MVKSEYLAPGLTVSVAEGAVADAMDWNVAVAGELATIDRAITAAGQAAATWNGTDWWWARKTAQFTTHTKTVATAANSGAQRTSNVSTITTTANHGLQAGQIVKVADVSDSTFDGIFVLASAATTALTYKQQGDDVAAATAGTGTIYPMSYPLRGIDVAGAVTATAASQIATDLWGVTAVHYDNDWRLAPMAWGEYESYLRQMSSHGSTTPNSYCLTGDAPYLCLWPPPASTYNIYVNYIRRHSKILGGASGSEDTALIVPAEFHEAVYVNGAVFLLRHETIDPGALANCPQFVETMTRMQAAAPTGYDLNTGLGLPHDRPYGISDDGWVFIGGEPSL